MEDKKYKCCTGECQRYLEINSENFHKTSRNQNGHIYVYYHSKCKICRNKEKKEYYELNREKLIKSSLDYYKNNIITRIEYYRLNKERIKKKSLEYYYNKKLKNKNE